MTGWPTYTTTLSVHGCCHEAGLRCHSLFTSHTGGSTPDMLMAGICLSHKAVVGNLGFGRRSRHCGFGCARRGSARPCSNKNCGCLLCTAGAAALCTAHATYCSRVYELVSGIPCEIPFPMTWLTQQARAGSPEALHLAYRATQRSGALTDAQAQWCWRPPRGRARARLTPAGGRACPPARPRRSTLCQRLTHSIRSGPPCLHGHCHVPGKVPMK